MSLPGLERDLAVEDDMVFSVEVASSTAGGAVAGTIEVVVCVGAETDGIVRAEIMVGDEAGDGARHGSVRAGRGRKHGGG